MKLEAILDREGVLNPLVTRLDQQLCGTISALNTYAVRVGGTMQKKLTITIDEKVYEGLHTVIGRRRISRFIETVVRPHVLNADLNAAYQQMAQDEQREAEALEWAEAMVGDVADEPVPQRAK